MTSPLLRVQGLTVDFATTTGSVSAVKDISFAMQRGQTLALVGESGSGKSVTAQTIMGLLPKSATVSGEITLTDATGKTTDLIGCPARQLRTLRAVHFGMIFQEPMTTLSPVHTIGSQLTEGVVNAGLMSRAQAREKALSLLAEVGFPVPERILAAYPFELSGGQRQRAVIAMALMAEPDLVIADEPTTALDVTVQAQVLALLKRLQAAHGMAVLLITHDLGVVAQMADAMVVVYRGRVMESGPARRLLDRPDHPYLQGLMQALPTLATDKSQRLKPIREIPVPVLSRTAPPPSATPVIEADSLIKVFPSRRGQAPVVALDTVSLSLAQGECLALVGESGSGKTTFIKALTGALTPDAGQITISPPGHGSIVLRDASRGTMRRLARHLQMVFQDPFSSLNPRMTVMDILTEPLAVHGIGNGHSRRERAAELLRLVGLPSTMLSRYPHSFSGGQRQRIAIARALALDPQILLLDEPVSALDVSIQAQVLNLLRDLRDALGLTYLFVSHNLAVVRYVADRVAVMCRGRLVELATADALFAAPRHPYTQALLSAVPDTDPGRLLDFNRILAGDAGDAANWPEVYQGTALTLTQVSTDHYVAIEAA